MRSWTRPAASRPGSLLAAGLLLAAAAGCATRSGDARTWPAAPGAGAAVVGRAASYTGTAYRAGGASPAGFDCSGFVQYLYGQLGVPLPRTAEAQFEVGRSIRPDRVAPGDLLFFRTEGRRISHVGIAAGDGTFIHAPNARSRVRIDRIDADYWADRYAGARRIVE